ncbi:MAG TPA: hypothetical protein VM717_04700 [Chthoniobacterales bacterium]|jgi:predicted RNA-binding Zn-ribbon protein involved in translation (DUF1610 family)|nr:hypothetical protein [Chthoniobacterales bacterium]
MTPVQKLVVAVLPKKWAASVEAESRTWIVRCSSCGFERSFWELGGIRWKAAGSERRYLCCPKCGQAHWHTISKRQMADMHAYPTDEANGT